MSGVVLGMCLFCEFLLRRAITKICFIQEYCTRFLGLYSCILAMQDFCSKYFRARLLYNAYTGFFSQNILEKSLGICCIQEYVIISFLQILRYFTVSPLFIINEDIDLYIN